MNEKKNNTIILRKMQENTYLCLETIANSVGLLLEFFVINGKCSFLVKVACIQK